MTGRIFFGSRGAPGGDGQPTANPTWRALQYEDRTDAHVHKVLAASAASSGNGSNGNGTTTKHGGNGGKKPQGGSLKPPKLTPLGRGDVPPSSVGGGTDVRELFCDVVIVGSGAGAFFVLLLMMDGPFVCIRMCVVCVCIYVGRWSCFHFFLHPIHRKPDPH